MDAPVKLMPQRTPFRILVSAVLSTRTQDPVTAAAADRLFQVAPDPRALARLSAARIQKLIYPVGFYRTKAKLLPVLSRMLTERWHGQVPRTLAELLELPGVGRKVANIVLSQGFGLPAIAVDTHVQRLSNRLDLVRTSRPVDTERRLMEILPRRAWKDWNRLLVALGQTICRPRQPLCSSCPLSRLCPRRGVIQSSRSQKPKARG
ncbi:endonuclease III [candidate division WOR-3 bacterium]|uniref:Endonuclease III n=1 Tax=candidate division WOR-3 bacterium TaxID=2052148 RepID=A0A938BU28_UNCW3|nr:endonuclease III [candidate division WOR-3 bacterium]